MNGSIIMIMAGQIRRVTKQVVDPDEELSDLRHLHELADDAAVLATAIRDRIGPSKDAYTNVSEGGP